MKDLIRLDCESTDSVYASLSAFSGLASQELLAKLDEFSESADHELAACERWQALADRLSVPSDSFEVCWFHGTRTANPESLLNGILPLQQRLEGIWNELAALITDRVDASEFARLRRTVEEDNYGTGNIPDVIEARMRDQGPYAFLIKAMAIKPPSGAMHHYSRVPEIVDLILCSFPEPHHIELKQRYFQQTKPCIVKFVSRESQRQIVGCAADYLLHLQKGYALECFLPWNFDGAGRQIPSQRILYSERINTNFAHS
jgi:hypothetical protein